jgi:ABC-type nitrate/sulfonate/bicarbonate transport system substrate-binding protein
VIKHIAKLCAMAAYVVAAMPPAHANDILNVGKSANAWTFIPVNVGVQQGIFAKYGLDVEISDLPNDVKLQQALASNSVSIGIIGGPTMAMSVKGSPVLAVAAYALEPRNMSIIVTQDSPLHGVDDLKGKLIGVPGTASLTEWLARRVALQEGWGKDCVRTVGLGGFDGNLAALRTHQTDAMVTATETGYMLEERGDGRILLPLGPFAPHFHTHVIEARTDLIAAHPDQVERFLKSYFAAIAFMKANKNQTTAIAMSLLHMSQNVMSRTYDQEIGMLEDDGHFDPEAVTVLKKSFVDMGILSEEPRDDQILTTQFVPVTP